MALKKQTMLLIPGIILMTGVVSFIFWTSDEYRAATPLVFIFGLVLLILSAFGQIKQLLSGVNKNQKSFTPRRGTAKSDERLLWRRQIPQLASNLFFTHIRQYPEWIRESRDYVPSSVTTAGRTEDGSVEALLYYADYLFKFKEWQLTSDGETEERQGDLEIIREDIPVLTLRVRQMRTRSGAGNWEPIAILAFDMNPEWIRELENLKTEILAIIKDREREARES